MIRKLVKISVILAFIALQAYLYVGLYTLTDEHNKLVDHVNSENSRIIDSLNTTNQSIDKLVDFMNTENKRLVGIINKVGGN